MTAIYTRVFAQVKPDDTVISPISALRFIPLSLRRTTSTPQDTGFATPWSWTYYGVVRSATFYELIKPGNMKTPSLVLPGNPGPW